MRSTGSRAARQDRILVLRGVGSDGHGAVDDLAVRLAKIEAWLEGQAERGVAAKFIAIDGLGKITLPRGSAAPEVQRFLQQLNQSRSEAKAAAKSARRTAATKLESEYKSLLAGLKNYTSNHKDLLSANEQFHWLFGAGAW